MIPKFAFASLTALVISGELLVASGCSVRLDDCDLTATCKSATSQIGHGGGGSSARSSVVETGTGGGSLQQAGAAGSAPTLPCNGTCSGATPICHAAKSKCVACTSDGECSATPATPICELGGNTCVTCSLDAHCPLAAPVCDPSSHTCGQCSRDAHCPASTPFCLSGTLTCVQCRTKEDCSGATPFCRFDTWQCVGCRGNSDCVESSPDAPYCNMDTRTCFACDDMHPCTSGEASRCDVQKKECSPCLEDRDCLFISGKPACLIGTAGEPNHCVGCTERKLCSSPAAARCDLSSHTCLPCQVDADCSNVYGKPYCVPSGQCVACAADKPCTRSDAPSCDLTTGECHP